MSRKNQKKQNSVDRLLDTYEATEATNFSIKLKGMPEKFFVTGSRLEEYYASMRPVDWGDYIKEINYQDKMGRELDLTRNYRIPDLEKVDEKKNKKLKKQYAEKGSASYGRDRTQEILKQKIEREIANEDGTLESGI